MQLSDKKNRKSQINNSFLEQLKSVSSGTTRSLKNDLLKAGARTAWRQFWGLEQESFEHQVRPEEAEKKEIQKGAAFETKTEVVLFTAQERQTAREIAAIREELLSIIKTVKEVDFEVEKAVMEIPVKPGVYHLRFLERIKRILRLIRQKLEDSRTWLVVSRSKRKLKGYWALYKKKGTSFGLSNERTLATQTG